MSLSVTGKPHLLDVLRSSSAARTCLKNYQADWERARQASSNSTPRNLYMDENGGLTPSHSLCGIFYLPPGEVKDLAIEVQHELTDLFPSQTLYLNPAEHLHITGLVYRDLSLQPYPAEDIQNFSVWADYIALLCQGLPAPRFSVYGVNLTAQGILYAKCYPHTDDFQNIRDEAQKLFPETRYKDIFNLSLGWLYHGLEPEAYQAAVAKIGERFLDRHLGTVQFDLLSMMNLNVRGLIASGELVREIQFLIQ